MLRKIYDKITGKGYTNYKLGYTPFAIMMYDEDMQAGEHNCEFYTSYSTLYLSCLSTFTYILTHSFRQFISNATQPFLFI